MYTFDDVLIKPRFSELNSRRDVSLRSFDLELPIISANMDTVTGPAMATAMWKAGGVGALHRFCSIEKNLDMYLNSPQETFCSIGLGDDEKSRARTLAEAGCFNFILDVAHGAQQQVVDQAKWLKDYYNINLIVGNFATPESIQEFQKRLGSHQVTYKVGIGPGAACTTRIKTGVGVPQFSAIYECSLAGPIIADGGIRTPGDVAKALAAGAQAVMVGRLLAGTLEAEGTYYDDGTGVPKVKVYRGSASKESYDAQGKNSDWITAEGASGLIPITGSVSDVLKDISGGLRSALTYVGASDIVDFRRKVEFIKVTTNANIENGSRI